MPMTSTRNTSEPPTTIAEEYGLWSMSVRAGESLHVTFRTPAAWAQRLGRIVPRLVKIGYIGMLIWIWSKMSPLDGEGVVILLCFLAGIPIVGMMRKGPHGDNRFIPFIVQVDARGRSLLLIDPRGRGNRRFCMLDQIERLELGAYRLDTYAPPQFIELQLPPGEVIFLPNHGLDAEKLLKPLRDFIAEASASTSDVRESHVTANGGARRESTR